MKTTINLKMMVEKEACDEAATTFRKAHGQKTVLLSEALESNGLQEAFWWIRNNELTPEQEKDIRLLACTYAEHTLHIFEGRNPDDKRPRKAIETARLYANGDVSEEELRTARGAAYVAAGDAGDAAGDAATRAGDAAGDAAAYAGAAAYAAAAYAGAAAYAAAGAAAGADTATRAATATRADTAERHYQTEELKKVFLKWEQVR
tara:strand:- start:15355 stop:15969 length:615 start_codon:yes stop_codon:yes gene_type:complete